MVKLDTHLQIDEKGVVRIGGTRMKVHLLAAVQFAENLDAEGLQEAYPFLTFEQIRAAMSYIDEHRDSIKQKLLETEQWVEALHREMGDSPLQERLRRLKQGQ